MTLDPSLFDRYFRAVHGCTPFAWQRRLLALVLDEGWGRPIALPTASGKTAVLDIAVFALALQAALPARERRTPRRIALVVDRRIVVDDAFRRAERIAGALAAPSDPVLREVAVALRSLGGEEPLECAALRGGLYQEDRWARTPLQPVILCSTVDQVGSRLLHRGYGLSPRSWPIHAGLLGHDTLVVVDEAHCAQPFLQTLEAVGRLRRNARTPLEGPWAAAAMTATPRDSRMPFNLDAADRNDPALARRLSATKRARLRVAKRKGDDGIAVEALSALQEHPAELMAPGSTTLVVLNRVRAARLLFDALRSVADERKPEVVLLTGRSRPVERDLVLNAKRDRMVAGRCRADSADRPPLIVVATQCIEVGADLDADALITECAPLDSLRQRFGRLDRLGERGSSPALILCRPEWVGIPEEDRLPRDADVVYGAAYTRTWWWLKSSATDDHVDFGIDTLDETLRRQPPDGDLSAPAAEAPFLFPAYCDLWAQTGPIPAVSPDPAVFLHGAQAASTDVTVVWRSDLDPSDPDKWLDIVTACPPVAGETMPLPVHGVRAWLSSAEFDGGTDLEGESAESIEHEPAPGRLALLWLGPDDSRIVTADMVRPGITLVVPCAWGGADDMGWTGRSADRPADVMEAARIAAGRPAVLRIHPLIGASEAWPADWQWLARLDAGAPEGLPGEGDLRAQVARSLASWSEQLPLGPIAEIAGRLADDAGAIGVKPHPGGQGLIVTASHRLAERARDFTDDGDASSLATTGAVTLESHLADVRTWAHRIATGAGLPSPIVEALALAGHLHDLGKADPRFQAWLAGGDPLATDPARPLAKSSRLQLGRVGAVARQRAGYPKGARHELLSVRLAESTPGLLPIDASLRDLVLHLVASHHGHCRPWAPVIDEPRPLTVRYHHHGVLMQASTATRLERLGSGTGERFWRLIREHGWWGLSFLEACLRLADHRASEQPGIAHLEANP